MMDNQESLTKGISTGEWIPGDAPFNALWSILQEMGILGEMRSAMENFADDTPFEVIDKLKATYPSLADKELADLATITLNTVQSSILYRVVVSKPGKFTIESRLAE